ncbi:MAG: redoxin domain-containing protein [Victivallales bacterium]
MEILADMKSISLHAFILLAMLPACGKAQSAPDIISENKGKVIVIMMGMEGCPGTEENTPFLTEYSKSKPDGVAVYRVDVPPPGTKIQKASNISADLKYVLDNERGIADKLEFFFYPTTYVLDRDGVVRYSGDCKPEETRKMVGEIAAEQPGAEKKMFTLPLASIGDTIPDFKMTSGDGKELSMKGICGDSGAILFFSSKSCPFSVRALSDLEKIRQEFKDKKFNCAIVSFGEGADAFKDLYSEKVPGSIVLVDKDKTISNAKFGVSAVPFFYVLDKDMKVVDRKPFQYDAAKTAVAKASGAGAGCGGAANDAGPVKKAGAG